MKSFFCIIKDMTLFPVLSAAASKWIIQKYHSVFEPQKLRLGVYQVAYVVFPILLRLNFVIYFKVHVISEV